MKFPISEQHQSEIDAALAKAAEVEATTFLGCWCQETGFCLGIEVYEGKPKQYHLQGPMGINMARAWFNALRSPEAENTHLH